MIARPDRHESLRLRLRGRMNTDKPGRASPDDLFGEGWLDKQLARVTAEIEARPVNLRPRFTGDRAAVQCQTCFLGLHSGECS
jgi:hypothetical protein